MRLFEFVPPVTQGPLAVPRGHKGIEVADIQKALVALGYQLPKYGVDGIRGPETSGAIKQFQIANKLPATGFPDPVTVEAMNAALAKNKITIQKSTAADVKGARQPVPSPAMKMDSVTQGKVGQVLNFIAQFESGGNYNVLNGGQSTNLTQMTIADVFELQGNMRANGHESTAVGRYQYIQDTLRDMVSYMRLDPNTTKFDQATQDAICIADLRRRCQLDGWLAGKVSDKQFLNRLAKVWAGIPTATGASHYAGVGSNKAGTTVQAALSTLQSIKAA